MRKFLPPWGFADPVARSGSLCLKWFILFAKFPLLLFFFQLQYYVIYSFSIYFLLCCLLSPFHGLADSVLDQITNLRPNIRNRLPESVSAECRATARNSTEHSVYTPPAPGLRLKSLSLQGIEPGPPS